MPILIKGSGGAQKAPTISVNSNGLITATAGKKSATKQLSYSDDADFHIANIKKGKNIFGLTGAYNAYESQTFWRNEASFERSGNSITLTFPVHTGSNFKPYLLAINRLYIGEGASNVYDWRWRFLAVIEFDSTGVGVDNCFLYMINSRSGVGFEGEATVSYTYDGTNLELTITDDETIGIMPSDATFFNDFDSTLFYQT